MLAQPSLADLANSLYLERPADLLFHYTSYEALLAIARSRQLWATEVRYLNDASEIAHAISKFIVAIESSEAKEQFDSALLSQFSRWLIEFLGRQHKIFVTCFSEEGNLLSQWRNYTPHGKGLNLGFASIPLIESAAAQRFRLGKCIYDTSLQLKICKEAVLSALSTAVRQGPVGHMHETQSYYESFFSQEPAILRIAALLKHPAFKAEREWRFVSQVALEYSLNEVEYRPGRTTLIPFQRLNIPQAKPNEYCLEQLTLGPTPEINLAMDSLSDFLRISNFRPIKGVHYCELPYRET